AGVVLETTRTPVLVLDSQHRIRALNPAFRRVMNLPDGTLAGKSVFSLAQDGWDLPALRKLLETVSSANAPIDDAEIELPVPGVGSRSFVANVRRTTIPGDDGWSTVIAFEQADGGSAS